MERALREELKSLSKELLGASSRYRKLMKTLTDGGDAASNGKPIKVLKYMTEEQVLVFLRDMKKEKEVSLLADKIQKEAGFVGK